jgi:hypothetical protein
MPRHIKIALIVLGVGFAITFGLFVNVIGRIQSMVNDDSDADAFAPPAEELFSPTDPPMAVRVFFPPADGSVVLSSEDRTIFRSPGLGNRAKQILQKVVDGPQSNRLRPSIPPEARLQEVFIDDTGVAYVDFSNALATNHLGGMVNEQATVYSIVNSLIYNLPEIRQVQILVGGGERETLKGHCLLLPLEMDLSITNVKPREDSQPRAD